MNRANPAKLRTALEVANGLAKAGVLFVAIPVADEADHQALLIMSATKMEQIFTESLQEGEDE